MRIAYLSDLHLEYEADEASSWFCMESALGPAADADLIVLAGDIDQGVRGVARADDIAKLTGKLVAYVPGNHEAYGEDLAVVLPHMRQAAWNTDGRVLFLDCNVARLWFGGRPLVVLGCTLWTDYQLAADPCGAAQEAERLMHDHDAILFNSGSFSPADAQALHRQHRTWLDAQLRKLALQPTTSILVVTHHAPVPEALGSRAAKLAMAYASDLRSEIASWPVLSWIHGHTHHRHATEFGKSLVASAPRGYSTAGAPASFVCGILDI